MKISDAISSLDSLEGKPVTVEGFLHSDTVAVWLNEKPRSEAEQLAVNDPRIAGLLLSTFPPRLGGVFAYCLDSIVQGVLKYDHEKKLLALVDIDSIVVNWNGAQRRLL